MIHVYVESKKIVQMNLFTKTKTDTNTGNKLMATKGGGRRDKLGVWD